jgi:hypothetical protein
MLIVHTDPNAPRETEYLAGVLRYVVVAATDNSPPVVHIYHPSRYGPITLFGSEATKLAAYLDGCAFWRVGGGEGEEQKP